MMVFESRASMELKPYQTIRKTQLKKAPRVGRPASRGAAQQSAEAGGLAFGQEGIGVYCARPSER